MTDDPKDPKSPKEAREETAKRLQFGINSVQQIIKEMLYERNVTDNKNNLRSSPNAYEKLDEEEEHDLRQLIHNEFRKCNVKRMTDENADEDADEGHHDKDNDADDAKNYPECDE